MEQKPSTNAFQEVHKKSQAVRKARGKAKDHATGIRRNEANEEAVREGFDRPATDDPTSVKGEKMR